MFILVGYFHFHLFRFQIPNKCRPLWMGLSVSVGLLFLRHQREPTDSANQSESPPFYFRRWDRMNQPDLLYRWAISVCFFFFFFNKFPPKWFVWNDCLHQEQKRTLCKTIVSLFLSEAPWRGYNLNNLVIIFLFFLKGSSGASGVSFTFLGRREIPQRQDQRARPLLTFQWHTPHEKLEKGESSQATWIGSQSTL